MTKRDIWIFTILILLVIVPSRALALDCPDLNDQYYLSCEIGACDGFKVYEQYKGGVCQHLPYLADLNGDEGVQLYTYLNDETEQIGESGLWLVHVTRSCANALRFNQDNELSESRIANSCGENGEWIKVEHLAETNNDQLLSTLQTSVDEESRSVRRSFYLAQLLLISISLIIAAILPFMLILRYLRTRKKAEIPLVVLAFGLQIGIVLLFLYLTISFGLEWARISATIIVPVALVQLGMLVGSKLEKRFHGSRLP